MLLLLFFFFLHSQQTVFVFGNSCKILEGFEGILSHVKSPGIDLNATITGTIVAVGAQIYASSKTAAETGAKNSPDSEVVVEAASKLKLFLSSPFVGGTVTALNVGAFFITAWSWYSLCLVEKDLSDVQIKLSIFDPNDISLLKEFDEKEWDSEKWKLWFQKKGENFTAFINDVQNKETLLKYVSYYSVVATTFCPLLRLNPISYGICAGTGILSYLTSSNQYSKAEKIITQLQLTHQNIMIALQAAEIKELKKQINHQQKLPNNEIFCNK